MSKRQQIYIVEGLYDNEPQFTSDMVMATSAEEAEQLVGAVRSVAACEWDHDATETLSARIKRLQKAARQSPAAINRGLEKTLKDIFGARCKGCGTPHPQDDLDENHKCEACASTEEEEEE